MSWFKVFSKNRIDEEILDLYLEIELLIIEIDNILNGYLKIIFNSNYYKSNNKNKSFYSIQKINYFFKKLKEEYGYCYTLRKNKNHYQFHKNAKSRAEKIEIEVELKKILKLLTEIHSYCEKLDKTRIKENDFSVLIKYVEKTMKTEKILEKIKTEDENKVFHIISKIEEETKNNIRKGIYLISQLDGKELDFSQELSINDIKYLDLVPLLELKELKKRSLFINELHKDATLPVYHYNLEINGRNIHVIPRNYKERIKPFLKVA